MTFEHPWVLLALAAPLLGAFALRRRARRRGDLPWPAVKRVAVTGNRVRDSAPPRLRPALLLMAVLSLAVVALARPQWGDQTEGAFAYTREVVIALDLSRSMLTEDVQPSRLELARQLTGQLLDGLQGESVALVVFAGTAFVQVPLGPDYQIVRAFLPNLDTDYLPQGGSDYGLMLDAAIDGFSASPDRDRYLVVLSDGESSTEGWESRLAEMARRDIHVISIGIGTAKGGFVPNLAEGGYLADANGDVVLSQLVSTTLEALARRTDGVYVDGTALADVGAVRDLLADTVETGRKGRSRGDAATLAAERFQWFLLPAILLGLVSLYREFPPRPSPRQVRGADGAQLRDKAVPRAAAVAAAAAAILVIGVGATGQVRAHFDAQADFEVREVFDTNPVQRLRAIVEHLAEFGYDAYDLRLMVEATIRYGVDSERVGAELAEGVLRDAIAATRRGEQLDASIADWNYYRGQLQAMLDARKPLVEERSEAPQSVMDEENDTPVVIGDGTQQLANDSFGLGASSRTDATLGDLQASDEAAPLRGRKPPPPKNARVAGLRPKSGASDGAATNPVLDFARERLDEAAKADSPGRLHLMMQEQAAPPARRAMDW